jgi:hypothetical protein
MSNKLFILSSKILLSGLGDFRKYSKIDHKHWNKGSLYSINIIGLKTVFCHLNDPHLTESLVNELFFIRGEACHEEKLVNGLSIKCGSHLNGKYCF